jgi:serine protease Do
MVFTLKSVFLPLPITKSDGASLGDKIYTIGFPRSGIQGLLPKYTEGTISSMAGIRDEASRFQVSVPVQPGNSGGALVNENGQIVGVIVSGLSTKYFLENDGEPPQVVNYAIKSSFLLGFLEGTDVRYIIGTPRNAERGKASVRRTQHGIGHVITR